jgi:hypothetical protein
MRKRIIIAVVAAITALVGIVAAAPSAAAGSDNGTKNWYSSGSCSTTGGRFDATNYDKVISGVIGQEYHLDADRAGGVGSAPKIAIQQSGATSWTTLPYWNDFYVRFTNPWTKYNFRVNFANGSQCYLVGL